MSESKELSSQGTDRWLTRVDQMPDLLNLPTMRYSKSSGRRLTACLQSKFDRDWLDAVQETRPVQTVRNTANSSVTVPSSVTSGVSHTLTL